MKNFTENAALHPNEDPSPVFRVVDGVILQVASGPVAGLTPTFVGSQHGGELVRHCPFKPSQLPWPTGAGSAVVPPLPPVP
jgi:hypothetical protein